MRVTRATDYALHSLMHMVRHITLLPLPTRTIAKSEGIPAGYLAKLFCRLGKAGILAAQGGRQKRYCFARDPQDISMLEVIETIEGGPLFAECFLMTSECRGTPDSCPVYRCWTEATGKVRGFLARTSIADAAWNHPDYCEKTLGRLTSGASVGDTHEQKRGGRDRSGTAHGRMMQDSSRDRAG